MKFYLIITIKIKFYNLRDSLKGKNRNYANI